MMKKPRSETMIIMGRSSILPICSMVDDVPYNSGTAPLISKCVCTPLKQEGAREQSSAVDGHPRTSGAEAQLDSE